MCFSNICLLLYLFVWGSCKSTLCLSVLFYCIAQQSVVFREQVNDVDDDDDDDDLIVKLDSLVSCFSSLHSRLCYNRLRLS